MKLVKRKYMELLDKSKRLFVGIDLHLHSWHVTVRTEDQELFNVSIAGTWEALQQVLEPYRGCAITAVYEAGYFGFWLHDRLEAFGVHCLVTPPSLIPMEVGNKVKTDRRDSRKLARLLCSGLLKAVWVPSPEELAHRQVIRRRRQLVDDRIRTQNRIKAELRFFGLEIASTPRGHWSQTFIENLWRLKLEDPWLAESFHRLLEEYEFLTGQIRKQTKLVEDLAMTERYKDRVALLRTVPGIGLLAAMELLLELQDVSRFRRAEELAAYVGLTPAQYSSGQHVRLGRITGTGKSALRGTLIEVSWRLVARDTLARKKYDDLKARAGAKRAVVAIARTTLLRTRRMLLDQVPYDTNAGRRTAAGPDRAA